LVRENEKGDDEESDDEASLECGLDDLEIVEDVVLNRDRAGDVATE
jgi:hypothetical protein